MNMKPSQSYTLNLLVFTVVFAECKSDFNCTSPGKFAHVDPTKFHECYYVGENRFTKLLQDCPQDTCFDATVKLCNIDYCERMMEEMTLPSVFSICPTTGKFPHLDSTRKDAFYKCIELQGKLHVYEYQCLPAKPCFSYHKQMCQPC